MRRLAAGLRQNLISIWRAVDVEGALLLFAIVGGSALAASYTEDLRAGLLVLVVASGIGGIVLARTPKGT